jgi:hypothetical protein
MKQNSKNGCKLFALQEAMDKKTHQALKHVSSNERIIFFEMLRMTLSIVIHTALDRVV